MSALSRYMIRKKLEGNIIAVTGAGQGIGRGICSQLAREGALVAALDINEKAAEQTAETLTREHGRQAIGIGVDVTSDEQITHAIHEINNRLGGVCALVNNAGVLTLSPFLELTEKDWDVVMDVNAKGVFLCSKLFASDMIGRKSSGVIVNISSIAGKVPLENQVHYCASKAAVLAITRVCALELAPYNIRVNAVCPGAVDTEMFHKVVEHTAKISGRKSSDIIDGILTNTEIRRLISPDEVGKLVAFLCSDDSAAISGQAFNIDGGNLSVNY